MNTQIYEEAAQWLVGLNSGEVDAPVQERFYAWLCTSPEHVRAYLELLPAWQVGTALPQTVAGLGIADLIQSGKSDTANVVSIPRASVVGDAKPAELQPTQKRSVGSRLAVAASLLILCLAGGTDYLYSRRGLYVTDTGEQQIVRLADGSTIELNSRSKVRVRFGDRQRNVELVEGQALFQVAHDTLRPFVVMTGRTQVRALGTEFDVNIKSMATIVTVVEGKVAVRPTSLAEQSLPAHPDSDSGTASAGVTADRGELLLSAGEQLAVAPDDGAALKPKQANVTNATAWTQRHLVFDASNLQEVIEEFNRYNSRHLILKDASLATFPITVAFESPDPSGLIRFLRAQPDIEVEESPHAILIYKK